MATGDMDLGRMRARIFSRLILKGWSEENAAMYTDGLMDVPKGTSDRRAAMEQNIIDACRAMGLMDLVRDA